jgi:AraC-like DNA-binding protein
MPQGADSDSPFSTFGDVASRPLAGRLRTSEMRFVRVGFGRTYDGLHVEMPRRDAFYAIFQLRDHPPHEHWTDGRATPAPASPRGSLHIADMNAAPSARLVGPLDSFNIVIPRALLIELAEDAGARPASQLAVPEPWQTYDPVLSGLEPTLVAALAAPESYGPLFLDHLALAVASHIAERYGALRRAPIRAGTLTPWQERRARDMIAANLTKELSLAEIAAECRLSLAHFSRAFKASLGITPHAWLQASRISTAKHLLQHPALSYAEIAVRCGFADQSHFTRTFKRATGLTPGAWRRSRA